MGRETYSDDDRNLVGRCQKGDERAYEELVRKYQQTVFKLVYHNMGSSSDVEDIAQKIFAKVYFSLPKFDNRRPFFPWLYRIAVNQCYDELRRARRRKMVTFTDLNLQDADHIDKLINQPQINPTSAEETRELHALLHKLLNQLSDAQRMVITLRDLDEVPYDKLAQILKCTEQAARLKVFRARARLRELLEKALRRQDTEARSQESEARSQKKART